MTLRTTGETWKHGALVLCILSHWLWYTRIPNLLVLCNILSPYFFCTTTPGYLVLWSCVSWVLDSGAPEYLNNWFFVVSWVLVSCAPWHLDMYLVFWSCVYWVIDSGAPLYLYNWVLGLVVAWFLDSGSRTPGTPDNSALVLLILSSWSWCTLFCPVCKVLFEFLLRFNLDL